MSLQEKLQSILGSASAFVPEFILGILMLVLVLADLIFSRRKSLVLPVITGVGLLAALLAVVYQWRALIISDLFNKLFPDDGEGTLSLFLGMVSLDSLAVFMKFIFLGSGILVLLFIVMSRHFSRRVQDIPESYALLASVLLGLFLAGMARNLLMVYLSIELVSLGSYVLTVLNFNRQGVESGMKYILFGAFASATMLYGMSLLYGMTGTLDFLGPAFAENLQFSGYPGLFTAIALFMVSAGLLFKITAVPFHIWAPDVYQGAPTPVAAFFSVAPKAAGLVVLLRLARQAGMGIPGQFDWTVYIAVIAILTILIGNLAALWQDNAKRMLAYSSIAHGGFMLCGLCALKHGGGEAMLFYMGVYLFMNFAAFLIVDVLSGEQGSDSIKGYKGTGMKQPLLGVATIVVMIALTGLPPTAGFTAKLLVFSSLWETYMANQNDILLVLFIFGLLNTVVSLFYYLKIPYSMFFGEVSASSGITVTKGSLVFVSLLVLPLLVLFFRADLLMHVINRIPF